MPSAAAPTAAAFLAALPAARREPFGRVRDLILAHLPAGYEEAVTGRMLCYQVPLAKYPDTYNQRPLWYAALASEKSYLSLHLMSVYADPGQLARLKAGFKAAGKKLDMGKACIHFQAVDDLPLSLIGELIGAIPLAKWVAIAKSARRDR
jgi:hypothetical protein